MSCWYLLHLPSLHQLQPALNCPLKMIDWKEQIRVFKYLNLGIVQIFLQHQQEDVNGHDNEQDPHTSSSKLSTYLHSSQHSHDTSICGKSRNSLQHSTKKHVQFKDVNKPVFQKNIGHRTCISSSKVNILGHLLVHNSQYL